MYFQASKQSDGLAPSGSFELTRRDPYLTLKQKNCVIGGTNSAYKVNINALENNYLEFKRETSGLARQEHTIHDILKQQPMYGKTANIVSGGNISQQVLHATPMQYVSPSLGTTYKNEHVAKAGTMSAILS